MTRTPGQGWIVGGAWLLVAALSRVRVIFGYADTLTIGTLCLASVLGLVYVVSAVSLARRTRQERDEFLEAG
jgi:hypothetical protein